MEEEDPEDTSISISVSLLRRIASMDQDDYWIKRLSALDEAHTRDRGLTIEEAEVILASLERCTKPRNVGFCVSNQQKLTDCLKLNRGKILECEDQVNNFIDCVDRLYYQKLRPELSTNSRKSSKLSFAERFQQMT